MIARPYRRQPLRNSVKRTIKQVETEKSQFKHISHFVFRYFLVISDLTVKEKKEKNVSKNRCLTIWFVFRIETTWSTLNAVNAAHLAIHSTKRTMKGMKEEEENFVFRERSTNLQAPEKLKQKNTCAKERKWSQIIKIKTWPEPISTPWLSPQKYKTRKYFQLYFNIVDKMKDEKYIFIILNFEHEYIWNRRKKYKWYLSIDCARIVDTFWFMMMMRKTSWKKNCFPLINIGHLF
jgi:hypothetical protein